MILNREINRKLSYKLSDYDNENIKPGISDTVFSMMFNTERGKKFTAYLLSLVYNLNYDYVLNNIEFMKQKLDKNKIKEKGMNVDLVCKVKNVVYNIEMNGSSTDKSRLERNDNYMNAISAHKSKVGKKYFYHTTRQINLDNFYFDGYMNVKAEISQKDNNNEEYTPRRKSIHFFLPLIRKKWYDGIEKLTEIEKFLLVINEKDSEKLEKLIGGNKIMREYREMAKEINEDDDIIGLYNKEEEDEFLRLERERIQEEKMRKNCKIARKAGLVEGITKGRAEGITQGRAEGITQGRAEGITQGRAEGITQGRAEGITQGREEEKLNIARKLLRNKVDINLIIASTGLTESKVYSLAK